MTRTCRSCGQPLFAGANFCANCGAREEASGGVATQTDVTQQAAAPVTQPVVSAPVAQPVPAPAVPIAPPVPATPAAAPTQSFGKWIAASAVIALVGIIVGAFLFFSPGSASGSIIADAPISAAGGKISMAGGGEIDVPKDAVSKPERIVVRKTVVRQQVVIPELNGFPSSLFAPGTLPLFVFRPNITFLLPITVILQVSPRAVSVRIFVVQNGAITLLRVIPARGGVVRLTVSGFQGGLLVI